MANQVQLLIQEGEDEIKSFVAGASAVLSADAKILWAGFTTVWETLAPGEWAAAEPIIQEAIADAFNGDFADLEQVVLEKAEAAGVSFFQKLDSAGLQLVLSLFVQKKAT